MKTILVISFVFVAAMASPIPQPNAEADPSLYGLGWAPSPIFYSGYGSVDEIPAYPTYPTYPAYSTYPAYGYGYDSRFLASYPVKARYSLNYFSKTGEPISKSGITYV